MGRRALRVAAAALLVVPLGGCLRGAPAQSADSGFRLRDGTAPRRLLVKRFGEHRHPGRAAHTLGDAHDVGGAGVHVVREVVVSTGEVHDLTLRQTEDRAQPGHRRPGLGGRDVEGDGHLRRVLGEADRLARFLFALHGKSGGLRGNLRSEARRALTRSRRESRREAR